MPDFDTEAVATVMSLASGLFGAFAQSGPDSYTIGASIIAGSKKSCPIFIGGVAAKSPAEQAGIGPGDRLLAVGGKDVKGMQLADVAKLIRSEQPGAVKLKLWRKGKEYEAVLQRQKFSSVLAEEGKKLAGDFLVPLDTTDEEVKRMMKNEERPVAGRAFPLHYPLNTDLYYGSFEILIFANPTQISVGVLSGERPLERESTKATSSSISSSAKSIGPLLIWSAREATFERFQFLIG